jgi:hypothetical protein
MAKGGPDQVTSLSGPFWVEGHDAFCLAVGIFVERDTVPDSMTGARYWRLKVNLFGGGVQSVRGYYVSGESRSEAADNALRQAIIFLQDRNREPHQSFKVL